MGGYCRCISIPTTSFQKNEIYYYEKFDLYNRISKGDEFLQNISNHVFDSYFIDLQKERDIKLDKILE